MKKEKLLHKDLAGWDIPIVERQVNIERKYRKEFGPLIREYRSKSHTPELMNTVWQGFWKQALGIEKNQVPRCNLATDEIATLEEKGKMLLLLPDVIFEAEGLAELANKFSWTRNSRITDINEARNIKHYSNRGGCVDVEATISTPVEYALMNEKDLRKKIKGHGRTPQRIPTYVTADIFGLLFEGCVFDKIGTSSWLLGSWYGGEKKEFLMASFDISKNCIVISNGNGDGSYSYLGGRSERVYNKPQHFWQGITI